MPTYALSQAGAREDFEAASDTDADRIARRMIREGGHQAGDPPATFRVEAHVARLGPGGVEDDSWTVHVDIDPDEPPCPDRGDAGHDWSSDHRLVGGLPENPGVFSSARGQVRIVTACRACGARKTDDLGGADHASGAPMRVITYEPPGTVDPPPMPVCWSVCSGSSDVHVAAVEPEPAGVAVPADVAQWAADHGWGLDDPDIYLLVATEDEAQVDIPGEIAWRKGHVSYAEDMAIRAALAQADAEDAEHQQYLRDTHGGT